MDNLLVQAYPQNVHCHMERSPLPGQKRALGILRQIWTLFSVDGGKTVLVLAQLLLELQCGCVGHLLAHISPVRQMTSDPRQVELKLKFQKFYISLTCER